MNRLVYVSLLAAIYFPIAAAAQAPADLPPLMPGDRVEIVFYPSYELNGTYTVTGEGTLLHPLFDRVQVAGVPVSVARSRIEDVVKYMGRAEPRFTFEPRYRVYVGGAVRGQGEYFVRNVTIGQAIVDAGGSTAPDRRHRIRLIRNGEQTLATLSGGSEAALLQTRIQSGDQILVEERPTFMRNYLNPALGVMQTVVGIVGTILFFTGIFRTSTE